MASSAPAHLTPKRTITACPPTATYADESFGHSPGTSGVRRLGEAVVAGHFLGGSLGVTGASIPGYALGPAKPIREDIAVGDPLAALNSPSQATGRVWIYEGDDPAHPLKPGVAIENSRPDWHGFGSVLASGNLNPTEDDRDELVIGVPGAQCSESPDSGAIVLVTFAGDGDACTLEICNPLAALPENAEGFRFGSAIAIGQADTSGPNPEELEVAVGSPGFRPSSLGSTVVDIGMVHLLSVGLQSGPSCADVQWRITYLKQVFPDGYTGFSGTAVDFAGFKFGSSVAMAPLQLEVEADSIAVGAPGAERNPTTGVRAGHVEVSHPFVDSAGDVYAFASAPEIVTRWDADDVNLSVPVEFGAALAAGDFDGLGPWDLVVGSPGSTIDGIPHVGEVCVFGQGLDTWGQCGWPGREGFWSPAGGERFGSALAVGNFDGAVLDRWALDLAVGAPGAGSPFEQGMVFTYYGNVLVDGGTRLALEGERSDAYDTWALGGTSHPGGSSPHARFGAALAALNSPANEFDDLAIGEPAFLGVGADTGSITLTEPAINTPGWPIYADHLRWSGHFERLHPGGTWELLLWQDPKSSIPAPPGASDTAEIFFLNEPEALTFFDNCSTPGSMEPVICGDDGNGNNIPCTLEVPAGTELRLLDASDPRSAFLNGGVGCQNNPISGDPRDVLCQDLLMIDTQGVLPVYLDGGPGFLVSFPAEDVPDPAQPLYILQDSSSGCPVGTSCMTVHVQAIATSWGPNGHVTDFEVTGKVVYPGLDICVLSSTSVAAPTWYRYGGSDELSCH